MNNQAGTSNTISQGQVYQIGGDYPVWARVREVYQGGNISLTGLSAGDVIHAGTPVIFNGPGKDVTIVKITDKANLAKVNGLMFNDVCIPAGCVSASCAVVRNGRIYANRANGGEGLPKSLEAQLPGIEFVYEADAPEEPTA